MIGQLQKILIIDFLQRLYMVGGRVWREGGCVSERGGVKEDVYGGRM